MDYLLKPVQTDRLLKTVSKVQIALDYINFTAINSEAFIQRMLAQLRGLLIPAPSPAEPLLRMIQASLPFTTQGHRTRLVPIDEVLYFEAADKYIRVFTATADYLIRTPLKDLLRQLDAAVFWQVHRATVVRASAIHTVLHSEGGKLSLALHHRPETLAVSRLYAHLFKPM